MYDLGEYFIFDSEKALMNPESILKGGKYRITILTDSLIRFEYNESGVFNDMPTEKVLYRNFSKPEFTFREDDKYLEISTKYVKILYNKEKNFDAGKVNPAKNLSVKFIDSDKFWYYNHPEARNVGVMPYDAKVGKVKRISDLKLEKGLFSFDGFVTLDDSDSMIIGPTGVLMENEHKGIDIYLFTYNEDYDKCLKDYFSITGYPTMIPRYALGNWWYKNESYTEESLQELVNDFRNNRVPLSVIMLNHSWHLMPLHKDTYLETGFTFNSERYKDPANFIKELHKQGVRLGLSINPFAGFFDTDAYYTKALEYLEADENGVIPFNVLDPKCVDVYFKLFTHPLDNLDVDFYFLDFYDKKRLNDLGHLKHYQMCDMDRNYKLRPMMLGYESGFLSHKDSILKSKPTEVGWDGLKKLALYNVLSSNNGTSWWSHDIGGYNLGVEDNELFTRYVELGVFSPILRLSSEKGKYYKREPWKWSIKTNTIVKEFLTLRHKLIPYLYSEAYKYSLKGLPLIRPLYYKDENMIDDELYHNEYYFGSELFIAPIINKKDYVMNRTIQKLYMPEGIWYDFFSGKKFPGGKEYVSFYREQDYPVFAHAGSIIPMGLNQNLNDTNPPTDMEIHIFPGKSNTYHMYEDDGISSLYKKDFYLLTDIDYTYMPSNYTVIIRAVDGKSGIVPERRNYKIIFRNTKMADDVKVYQNDTLIEHTSYLNGPDFIVEIKDAKTIGQLTIHCKGKDIEIDAVRIINNDIETILSDIEIPTVLKEKIDAILFDKKLTISKKRIAIRKLKRAGLEPQFIKLFLKLLEYLNQV